MFTELISVMAFDLVVMYLFIRFITNLYSLSVFTINVEDTLSSQNENMKHAFENLKFSSRYQLINDMVTDSKANIVVLQGVPNTACSLFLYNHLNELGYHVIIQTIPTTNVLTISGFRGCTLKHNSVENALNEKYKISNYLVEDQHNRIINIVVSYSYDSCENILNYYYNYQNQDGNNNPDEDGNNQNKNVLYIGQAMKSTLGRNHTIHRVAFPHEVDFPINMDNYIQLGSPTDNPIELRELYTSSIEKENINIVDEYYMPLMFMNGNGNNLHIKNIQNVINVNGNVIYHPEMDEIQLQFLRNVNIKTSNVISGNWCGVVIHI